MPYIGNITSDFSIDTGNITNRAVTALKLSPSSVGSNGQVLSVDGSGNLQWSTDAALTLIDEDNMSSNSASSVPSQQSVKAYADTKAVLTGSTNNTITTVTGANALQGEASLTYDGSELKVLKSSGAKITLENTGNAGVSLVGDADRTGADDYIFTLDGKWNGTSVAAIRFESGADTTNKDDGIISFWTAPAGTKSERLRITSDGVALFNGLTSQTADTSKLAVQGGDSNIGIIQVHAGGGESDGDLSGITFSHGASNATARAKGAIALRCDGSGYGRGDLCFYVDGTGDNNQVAAADEQMRIDSKGRLLVGTESAMTTGSDDHRDTIQAVDSAGAQLLLARKDQVTNPTNRLGEVAALGNDSDGTFKVCGSIRFEAELAHDTNDKPTAILFKTCADNSTTLTERLRISADGKVGIGTTSPDTKLHLEASNNGVTAMTSANNRLRFTDTDTTVTTNQPTGVIEFESRDSGNEGIQAYIACKGSNTGQGSLHFATGKDASSTLAERITIDQSGNLGIGTTSPGELLSLRHATSNTVLDFECLAANDGTTGNIIKFRGKGANGVSYHASQIKGITENGANNAGFLSFWTNNAGTIEERLRITSGGAIGIGTTSPQQSSHPSIHLHGSQNDDARIAITTPNKTDGRIGYYGLSNRFGIDMYNGFQIRDVGDSYATRFMIISNGNTSIGTDNSNSRLTLNSGSSNNAVSIRNTEGGNGHVGILFSTQDSSTGREKAAIFHQETHGTAHYAGDLVYCMNNATGSATQVGISDERFRMKRDGRFEMKASNTSTAFDQPLLKVQLSGESTTDKTFISLWNGSATGDISTETSHIDFVWEDSNANVKPQARISGNVGDGTDSNSMNKEGKGYLTFHCSNTSADSGEENPGQRLKIAHDGTFTGSGSANISDQRLKENIATITDATTKIKGLTGRTFTWKAEADMQEGTKYGFIAQEVEPIVSDLVFDWTGIRVLDKDGQITKQLTPDKSKGDSYAKSVNAEGVIPILVEALKEALTEIDTLKTKVAALEAA